MDGLLDELARPGLAPFLFAAVLVLGLLAIEVVLSLIGVDTTLGDGADFVEPVGFDLAAPGDSWDAPAGGDVPPEQDGSNQGGARAGGAGLLDLLGLAGLPLTVWLALLCGAFASGGLVLQAVAQGLAGATLPVALAVPPALAGALVATRAAGGLVHRLLPRETTSAISERSFGNRTGRVVVGTARRGSPAQVRFQDGHGNTHYAMAEPLGDDEAIPGGAEVVILRTRDGALRLVRTA